jgi:TonB family protein
MKSVFALILLTFSSLCAFSQKDTIIYYSKLGKSIDSGAMAQNYDQVKKMTKTVCYLERYSNNKGKWVHLEEDKKSRKINDSTFSIFEKITSPTDTIHRIIKKVNSGFIIKDFQNNFLVSTGFSRLIIPLIKEGQWVNYYQSTHSIKSIEEYKNNQLTGNKRWKETGEEDIADVFPVAEKDPEFQGGHDKLVQFLSKGIKFPGKAKRRIEQGTVTAQFIVMEDGSINGVDILKGVSPSLDEESIRVLKSMPTWAPGLTNGKPVRVALQVPFQYSIPIKK